MSERPVPGPSVSDADIGDTPMSDEASTTERGAPRRVAPIIVLVVAVVIAGFFVILARAKSDTADTAYSPLIGKPAPAITATTLDGKKFDLQRRKGSWVILNFFNSTCGPCVQEHPELVQFQSEQAVNGTNAAELYSVVWNDLDGGTAKFFETNPVAWPVLIDKDAAIAVAFGVAKVPETWIINPNGYVVTRIISALTDDQLTRIFTQQVAEFNGTTTTTAGAGS